MNNNLLTLFGLGKTKFSASTSSLLVLPIYWSINYYSPMPIYINSALFILVLLCSMVLLNKHKKYAISDPKEVVVDEFLGMHIALIMPNTTNYYWMVALFVAFRIIDILKPFPFSWIEKKCSNQFGLLVDDIAIGVFVGAVAIVIQNLMFQTV